MRGRGVLRFFSDRMRHLVCWPYSVENLHAMAREFGIKRCWFHANPYPHYDIPKRDLRRIWACTEYVRPRALLKICQGEVPP